MPASIRSLLALPPLASLTARASPRHLARTMPSSSAEQPPWPRSGVLRCSASPATHTLPLLMLAVTSTSCGTFEPRSLSSTNCFIFGRALVDALI
ncbi:hypothetical protein PVAP13_5NG213581 [Panicum virgatum]|uniref:Uncharacterized protein n=1 Tax=Panicum virgatum TaxID=38727 RepID=A0A8T0RSI2_PANVG|nr:hypothetical protein PVAP13_5NG213581 [Panicum virgatum]